MSSGIFGAAGQVAGAAITAGAMENATRMQIDALREQKNFVYNELDPTKIGAMSQAADVDRAKARLALQSQIDPQLLQARYTAEQNLLKQQQGIGNQASDAVQQQAAGEALAGGADIEALKHQLIDAAHNELAQGATLPPDVQAELVKAGLEKGSLVSGNASPKGMSGLLTRKLVGQEALNLQAQRQGRAAALGTAAQSLETARAGILSSLFPALKSSEAANQSLTQSGLTQANQMVPEAGLGGSDIANIWLARVGATNQLAQSAADAAARGATSQAQIWNGALGGATRALAPAAGNAFDSVYKGIFGGSSPAGGEEDAAGSFALSI